MRTSTSSQDSKLSPEFNPSVMGSLDPRSEAGAHQAQYHLSGPSRPTALHDPSSRGLSMESNSGSSASSHLTASPEPVRPERGETPGVGGLVGNTNAHMIPQPTPSSRSKRTHRRNNTAESMGTGVGASTSAKAAQQQQMNRSNWMWSSSSGQGVNARRGQYVTPPTSGNGGGVVLQGPVKGEVGGTSTPVLAPTSRGGDGMSQTPMNMDMDEHILSDAHYVSVSETWVLRPRVSVARV